MKYKIEQIKIGCGFLDNYSKSSLCKEGNLCSDCKENLKLAKEIREEVIEEISNELIEINQMKVPAIDKWNQFNWWFCDTFKVNLKKSKNDKQNKYKQ